LLPIKPAAPVTKTRNMSSTREAKFGRRDQEKFAPR